MRTQRSIQEPIRTGLDWHQTWTEADKGLIKSWEIGRQRAELEPALAEACRDGALPPLGWKGGSDRQLKKLEKFGGLHYLAEWQGLRGEDLDIDQAEEPTITCTKTGMIVTFTSNTAKLAIASQETTDGPTQGVSQQPLVP